MARRRQRDSLTVSLFPFLSVLACVIGTLTLLLAALAIGQLGAGPLENARLAARFRHLQAFLEKGRDRIEGIRAALSEEEKAQRKLGAARDTLDSLGVAPGLTAEQVRELASARAEAATLELRREELEQEIAKIATNIDLAESELGRRRVALGPPPIRIERGGLGRDLTAYFVECKKEFVVLHRASDGWTFPVPVSELGGDSQFKVFLRRIRAMQGGIVIFLVRPDGVATHRQAARAAQALNVRQAKLPLPGHGEIQFAVF